MWYDELFMLLESRCNEERAVAMAAYMQNNFRFLGISKPELISLSKPAIKAAAKQEGVDWCFVNACWEKEYREAQYVGAEYLLAVEKRLTPADLPRIARLITTKPWWDIADTLDCLPGTLLLEYPQVYDDMIAWSKSRDLWLRRVSIDSQQRLKNKTDTGLLETVISNNLGSSEFFINKAIGWSLREYGKTNPAWVRDFLNRYIGRLSKLSVKEASKYLKE